MKARTTKTFGLAALPFLGLTMAALAACPGLPDGPDSYNVTNGQQQSLCLQQQLHDSTLNRNLQTELNGLTSTIQQQQIQRRFDDLPRVEMVWP